MLHLLHAAADKALDEMKNHSPAAVYPALEWEYGDPEMAASGLKLNIFA